MIACFMGVGIGHSLMHSRLKVFLKKIQTAFAKGKGRETSDMDDHEDEELIQIDLPEDIDINDFEEDIPIDDEEVDDLEDDDLEDDEGWETEDGVCSDNEGVSDMDDKA